MYICKWKTQALQKGYLKITVGPQKFNVFLKLSRLLQVKQITFFFFLINEEIHKQHKHVLYFSSGIKLINISFYVGISFCGYQGNACLLNFSS